MAAGYTVVATDSRRARHAGMRCVSDGADGAPTAVVDAVVAARSLAESSIQLNVESFASGQLQERGAVRHPRRSRAPGCPLGAVAIAPASRWLALPFVVESAARPVPSRTACTWWRDWKRWTSSKPADVLGPWPC